MEIYQRNINVVVKHQEEGAIAVEASLLDMDHSMRVGMTIDIPTRKITDTWAEMPKTPFDACPVTLGKVSRLIGLVVERGVSKKVVSALGREEGCVHLVELSMSAIRLAAGIITSAGIGIMPAEFAVLGEKERLETGRPFLSDTCYVYSEKRLKEVLGC